MLRWPQHSSLSRAGTLRLTPVNGEPPQQFLQDIESLGVEFDASDLGRLGVYLDLLLEVNTRFNLTAITDREVAWHKHIFDSLTLLPLVVSAEVGRVIDVGSGAGLPGLPLAITLPEVNFTLLEATGKKADFLREVVGTLMLPNVTVIAVRLNRVFTSSGRSTPSSLRRSVASSLGTKLSDWKRH